MSRLQDVIKRGTRANQPAATAVSTGTLYYVTDEEVLERSSGSAWEEYSGAAGGAGYYTVITKVSSDTVTNNGTLTNDSELTFAVTQGVYEVEFEIWYEGTTAATNFKWSFDLPTMDNIALFVGTYTCYTTGGTVTETPGAAGTTSRWPSGGTGTQIGVPVANLKIPFFGKFLITVPAAGGTIVFKFAQGSASVGNSVIVRPGSTVKYKKLA